MYCPREIPPGKSPENTFAPLYISLYSTSQILDKINPSKHCGNSQIHLSTLIKINIFFRNKDFEYQRVTN